MKIEKLRFVALLFIALLIAGKSFAQDNTLKRVELGVRYMPTFSSIDLKTVNDDVIEGSVSMKHGFGVMLGINLSKHFGIQGEIDYYEVSQEYRDLEVNREVDIKYINIPLLLSLNTNKEKRVNLNVVAGPQFGINAGASIKTTGTENTEDIHAVVAVKKADVGIAYGAGLEFALNQNHSVRLDLGYRGFYGLVDINDSKSDNNTYNVVAEASRKSNAVYAGFTLTF